MCRSPHGLSPDLSSTLHITGTGVHFQVPNMVTGEGEGRSLVTHVLSGGCLYSLGANLVPRPSQRGSSLSGLCSPPAVLGEWGTRVLQACLDASEHHARDLALEKGGARPLASEFLSFSFSPPRRPLYGNLSLILVRHLHTVTSRKSLSFHPQFVLLIYKEFGNEDTLFSRPKSQILRLLSHYGLKKMKFQTQR